MNFRIADTFTDSLARLTGEEQKAVKTTAFDLQLDPLSPGMRFHRLDKARDKHFWSLRVGSDLRLIVHRSENSLLLCYVGHHDKAYDWAERRKLETHPKTGAAQLVEIRETVQEIVVPVYLRPEPDVAPKAPLLATRSDDELLGYGVPPEWLKDVKQATEDTLLALVEHLPAEAAEAVLELATGGTPRAAESAAPVEPFEHPDALRRFRVMANVEELERALAFPWEKWTVFLHPDQRELIERDWQGPTRVSGSAGTGKTIVALHRAAHLARRHGDARVLLTTFSDTLAQALRTQLRRLLANEPRLAERIDVHSLDALGLRLHKAHLGAPAIAGRGVVTTLMREAAGAVDGHCFGMPFLLAEWDHVVDAWQLDTWEAYRDVARLGRKTRLPEPRRALAWAIFERVRAGLRERGLITGAELFTRLAAHLSQDDERPFDFAVVDEAQDLGVPHVRFFGALGGRRPDALFFASDLGQRIFQQPFSWKALGIDVRGRSRTLRVCYRTSHQIRAQADRLLGPVVSDVDGESQTRTDTVSVFNGPPPVIRILADEPEEIGAVGAWIAERLGEGVLPHEIGVFVRSAAELDRARAAVERANVAFAVLDDDLEMRSGRVSLGIMHLAKGLEFRAVVVMACDDEIVPLQQRIEAVGDEGDLREVYETERHLLYVACTRARDHLLVTSVEPGSEFLEDMRV
jgi:mRNA-degrading endonuclease RelE of RelBE toxin-antitoxin system